MKRIHHLIVLTLIFMLAALLQATSEQLDAVAASEQFRTRMADYRKLKGEEWRKLADFSFESGLNKFAELDETSAKSLGFPAPTGRKFPDTPLPEDALELYRKWGKMRESALEKFRITGLELLQWTTENYSPGLTTAAKELLAELPDEPDGHKALGETYSEELGWVTGTEAANVIKGLLPFGRGWIEREKVVRTRSEWSTAWEFETTYFMVRTNTSPELARKLVRYLERFREAWLREFSGFNPPRSTGKLAINLFSNIEDYRKISRILFNGAEIPGAYYSDMTGHTYIVAGTRRDEFQFSPTLVAHEHSHQFLHQFMNAPCWKYYDNPGAWINEALASYCETVIQAGDRLAFAAYRNNYHFNLTRQLAKSGEMRHLADFVNIDGSVFSQFDNPDRGAAYFQGMALTSYLLNSNDGKYRKAYFRYVNDLIAGKGSKTRFATCFGIKPEDMEQDFLTFLLR